MTESRRHATLSQTQTASFASLTPTVVVTPSEGNYSSGSSKRFRETTQSIPTPEEQGLRRPKAYQPVYAHPICTLGIPIMFICLGVALEIALNFSNKSGGFKVPTVNVFGTVSGQFLASIIPTSIILPYAILYRSHDWVLRWFQPYVVLQRGNASAEESLLLDYIDLGPFFALFRALKYKHRILFMSSLTAFITYSFQPLAGSIFQIRQLQQTSSTHVKSLEQFSLADDIGQLNGFVAAAGYAEAATVHGLGDPPFTFRNWSTAAFDFPKGPNLNGTLVVNTTAVSTQVNCANPARGIEVLNPGSVNISFSSTSVDNCSPSSPIQVLNSSIAPYQYGVIDAVCPDKQVDDVEFRPVMFWFLHFKDGGTLEAKTVFCAPTILPFYVTATAHLEDGTLDSCNLSTDYDQPNNITGPPNNGRAFNGVIFNHSTDPFVQARANNTASSVPGTIFRAAFQPSGLQATFDLPNGMLDLTSQIYTQHLSVSAKSIYFVKNNSTINAAMTDLVPRLWIDPLPGHFLALCLFAIGIIGFFVHLLNYRQRSKLILAAPPGSIASITALTARSGFGELLLPYDNEEQLEKKLDGIKFRLDRRTGAIVADEVDEGVPGTGREEALLSLLGRQNERLSQHSTSSQASYQAAVGYPPWVYKTPYDRIPD
ncbi:hypothetical protein P691DRAFT_708152 [Macrolepiota fuliginosa MF-IS2]|uniref:Uncharacterized protein n=1 Tax=Macrolepiota fuliginosa MF-IS2 TaxID=1400762 RepID=A0A9P5X8X3_9AGAR|nr:hypothetical protein P691DRAFT_708152 [Macrolepiota fuliginosa MF-IS2]